MSSPGTRRATIVVVVALLLAGLFTWILLQVQPRSLYEWFIQLTATAVAALLAVGVFEYQSRQAERDRHKRLLAALAAELQSNLHIIRSEPRTPFQMRNYKQYADAKLVPMQPIAADAAIRSGVFDADDIYTLTL